MANYRSGPERHIDELREFVKGIVEETVRERMSAAASNQSAYDEKPHIRMQCLEAARGHFPADTDAKTIIEMADKFAEYVLNGKKPEAV